MCGACDDFVHVEIKMNYKINMKLYDITKLFLALRLMEIFFVVNFRYIEMFCHFLHTESLRLSKNFLLSKSTVYGTCKEV